MNDHQSESIISESHKIMEVHLKSGFYFYNFAGPICAAFGLLIMFSGYCVHVLLILISRLSVTIATNHDHLCL